MSLPIAPKAVVGADGVPLFGRYAGLADAFDWQALAAPYRRGAVWRQLHHKRWHYVALAAGELFCAVAIVDLGWISTAFAYVFERRQRRVIAAFSQDGLPGIGARVGQHAGQGSSFSFLGKRIAIVPAANGGNTLMLRGGGIAIDAVFGGAGPMLLAVGPVEGGSVHATQKSSALELAGTVAVGGVTYRLDGGVASVDYSNGLLARETAWRWASAHCAQVGFNLQAGYFGAHENALWLDGELIGLGAARFDYTAADPMLPWHVSTDDGLLDLVFTPEGARREDKDLVVAASRYVQPIGTFSGTVRAAPGAPAREVRNLVGVTEDHSSRW